MAVKFRDTRTGRWRKPQPYEKNEFYTIDTLSRGIASFAFKTMEGMGDIAESFAQELLDYAQNNAPWTDRTGDARRGLEAEAFLSDDDVGIELYHTVSYGIWLEIRWGGRYAIIIPTVEAMGPRLYDKMQGMLGDIIYYE